MLVSKGEKLSDGQGSNLSHRLDQPFNDRSEHLIRAEVERAAGETRVALVQQAGAKHVKAVHRTGEQRANNWLCWGITRHTGQFVQIMLDGNSRAFRVPRVHGRAL